MIRFNRVFGQRPVGALLLALLACVAVACGGGSGPDHDWGGNQQTPAIKGRVFAGDFIQATVCLDKNKNGLCETDEPSTPSDAAGAYDLKVPVGSTGPLIARAATGGYRLASPSSSYSTNITPFTTLVHLSAQSDLPLAEDIVRDVVGLPSKFRINIDSPAAAGTLTGQVARGIVVALAAVDGGLNMADSRALRTVAAAFPRSLTDLPVLRIDTAGGAAVDSTETLVDATYTLSSPALSSTVVLGTIRGRGHYSWGRPKNPYRVEFNKNDPGLDRLPDVFGMPKNRHWVLLADFYDRSLVRNKLALALGSSSVFSDGMKWNPSGLHVEVYLNGDYIGVYLLCEDIRIASSRLDIKSMGRNDVDGGYIVEVDSHYGCSTTGTEKFLHLTPQGIPVCIHEPNDEDITGGQIEYAKDLLNKVEGDIYGSGSVETINTTSFADWYILNELFRNVDANFYASVFMWKDSAAATSAADRLLNMGPIWDFDLSVGNVDYLDGWKTEGCWVNKERVRVPNWFARLFDNSGFLNLTLARWKQKRPAIERFVNASIETYASRLDAAQRRNYDRWGTLGVPLTNYYTFATYAEEVAFVKSFLADRMAWLDKAYASPESYATLCK